MQIPDILNLGVVRFPEKPCFGVDGRFLTFAQLDYRADRVARLLRDNGVEPGDRIAFLGRNELEFAELQFGAQRAGAIFAPMNYRLSVAELDYIVRDCAPVLLFVAREYEAIARQLPARVIVVGDADEVNYLDAFDGGAAAPGNPRMRDGSVIAQLLYTSGTTGFPKGAMVSNAALHARMVTYAFELGVRENHVMIQTLPMFHLTSTFSWAHLLFGAGVVMVKTIDPGEIWSLVRAHRATCLKLVPTVLGTLLDDEADARASAATLQSVIYGASAITPDLLERARAIFPDAMMNLYGLTEGGAATIVRPADHDTTRYPGRLNSIGFDMVNYETAVMSPEGAPLPVGEAGEICIRGPGIMSGYWGDPDSSSGVLRDGWVRTGDGGLRSAEGMLVLTDRIKDTIISGGENVFSIEVERALSKHPAVRECAVVAAADDRLGERVHAVVVPASAEGFSLECLDRHCRDVLAGYKRPRSWSVVNQLPRNAMGKVAKTQLRADMSSARIEIRFVQAPR